MRWLIVLGFLCASPAAAQETRMLATGEASPPATIDQLSWLVGTWRGEGFGSEATEVYSASEAGQIAGHFVQHDKTGGVKFYELMQIVPRGGSLVYRLRHFNGDLTGWEDDKQGKAVEFPLVALAPNHAYFEGMTLIRDDADTLRSIVRIDEGGGKSFEATFRYRRAAN